MREVAIVGGGVGGLASGALLAAKGVRVTVYEKNGTLGGRSSKLQLGEFSFDLGPTFFMYRAVLEELFTSMNLHLDDHLKLRKLDPLYSLHFEDFTFNPSSDADKTLEEIRRRFPGNEKGYLAFRRDQARRFKRIARIMRMRFDKPYHYLHPNVLRGIPYINPFRSIMSQLRRYYRDDSLIHASAFQSKYLGLSPYETPALFTILSFLEHVHGLYHVEGGLNAINHAFARIIEAHGGDIQLNTPVEKIETQGRQVKGLVLEDGTRVVKDGYFLNADFARAMTTLLDEKARGRYTDRKLSRMKYSLSTFNLYLGMDTHFDIPHHNILFPSDYEAFIRDIGAGSLPDALSVYLHNPSTLDPTLAPKGKSALYALVPVPNNDAGIDWDARREAFKGQILDTLEARTGMKNLRAHIVESKTITPRDWERDYHVHKGAVFNLAHNYSQMLYFRPHNQFNSLDNLYLTGGGTHPGSGLPTIYLSAKISTDIFLSNMASRK